MYIVLCIYISLFSKDSLFQMFLDYMFPAYVCRSLFAGKVLVVEHATIKMFRHAHVESESHCYH